MIDQKQIPPEVVGVVFQRLYTLRMADIRAAIAAGLAAWPGVVDHPETPSSPRCLWLPLSTEPTND